MALSDDFSTDRIGQLWAFHAPGPDEASRRTWSPGMMRLKASGKTPTDSRPLTFICGDLAYEATADIEIDEGAEAGVLLFYSPKLYCGLGFNARGLVMHRVATQRGAGATPDLGRRMQIRVVNDRHNVTMYSRTSDHDWTQYGVRIEVSGYNHNTAWDFLSLRPGIYCAGQGEARIRSVAYRAL
jgi:beta-xylosidase